MHSWFVNTCPSTKLLGEDANAHANSTLAIQILCVHGNQHPSQLYPNSMLVVLNSLLLWAVAHATSIFLVGRTQFELHVNIHVVVGQHPSDDYIRRYGPPHPNFSWVNICPSATNVLEDAMPMQVPYLSLWAASHPNSYVFMGIRISCLLPEIPCCCWLAHVFPILRQYPCVLLWAGTQ